MKVKLCVIRMMQQEKEKLDVDFIRRLEDKLPEKEK